MHRFKFLLLSYLFFLSQSAFSYGLTGHRTIAEIAENHLSCKAKKQIKKIIGKQPLAYWSNWPDFIKSNPDWKIADSWHYINFTSGLDRNQFNQELTHSSEENLYKRIILLKNEIKNHTSLSDEQKRESLYFLIHLMGDAHQPLHIGKEEDLGGNKFKVEWFNEPTNLHTLWDTKLINFQNYSYTEYAKVLDFHDKKYNQSISSGNLEDWLFENYNNAQKIYKSAKMGEKLSYKYNYDHIELMEDQLLKGGLRLAKVLNDVFG